jgi:hypothetical protein
MAGTFTLSLLLVKEKIYDKKKSRGRRFPCSA